jgi:hypothetical protein
MKIAVSVACLAAFLMVGCQSKIDCLKKYNFSSCEEFQEVYKNTKDNDEALKMHSIMIECGCKVDQ